MDDPRLASAQATQLKENIRDSERKIEEETLQAEALRQRILRKSGATLGPGSWRD